MDRHLTGWAASLSKGARRVFGYLQVDIAKHSSLPGADLHISETRDNLHRQILGILTPHGAQELAWAGDGGAYLFLIDQNTEFDRMVTGALQILDSMRLFNTLSTLNTLDVPLRIRISCHKGEAIWDPDLSNFYGKSVNYFLKSEREIGVENRVTLTEEVFEQLLDRHARALFTPYREHEYHAHGRRYERTIYACSSIDSIVRPKALQPGEPVSATTLAGQLADARQVDLMLAGGDAFYRQFYEALRQGGMPRSEPLDVRVLLRRSSTASSRSARQFAALAEKSGIRVEIRWYDWDFMLRGYCFDRKAAFVSYFLRESDHLTGRYNPMVQVVRQQGEVEDFLIEAFCSVFDAYFSQPHAAEQASEPAEFVREP